MKAIFTSLMILMVTLVYAQEPKYTYIDPNNNTYEYSDGLIKYTPANSTTSKMIEISKAESTNFDALFKAAIDAKADRVTTRETGAGTIKWKLLNKEQKIHLKASSTARTTLETALKAKL